MATEVNALRVIRREADDKEKLHGYYNEDCSDMELVSKDGIVFRVSSERMGKTSKFFQDMNSLPLTNASAETKARVRVPLADFSADAIAIYLNIVSPSRIEQLPYSLDQAEALKLYHLARFLDSSCVIQLAHEHILGWCDPERFIDLAIRYDDDPGLIRATCAKITRHQADKGVSGHRGHRITSFTRFRARFANLPRHYQIAIGLRMYESFAADSTHDVEPIGDHPGWTWTKSSAMVDKLIEDIRGEKSPVESARKSDEQDLPRYSTFFKDVGAVKSELASTTGARQNERIRVPLDNFSSVDITVYLDIINASRMVCLPYSIEPQQAIRVYHLARFLDSPRVLDLVYDQFKTEVSPGELLTLAARYDDDDRLIRAACHGMAALHSHAFRKGSSTAVQSLSVLDDHVSSLPRKYIVEIGVRMYHQVTADLMKGNGVARGQDAWSWVYQEEQVDLFVAALRGGEDDQPKKKRKEGRFS